MQLHTTNFVQPNLLINKTSFKGHTEKAKPVYISRPGGSGHNYNSISNPDYYEVAKNATPNYPGAYPNEYTKVYVAAPFEIIPEETYKTHDYTLRTDLRLRDIQDEYKKDSNVNLPEHFSNNSSVEKNFLEEILDKAIVDEGTQTEKNKRLQGMMDMAEKPDTKNILAKKLERGKAELSEKTAHRNLLEETLVNANERHTLLKELDGYRYERGMIKEVQANPWEITCAGTPESKMEQAEEQLVKIFAEHRAAKTEHKASAKAFNTLRENSLIDKQQLEESIAKEKESYETTYKRALAEAKELKWKWSNNRKWNEYQKDYPAAIAKLEQLMDECMKKIEILYKTKYPHWL